MLIGNHTDTLSRSSPRIRFRAILEALGSAQGRKMIEIVYGTESLTPTQRALVETIRKLESTGTLYIGYPILTTINGALQIDALLTSIEHGLVAFDLTKLHVECNSEVPAEIYDRSDQVYSAITSKMTEDGRLISRRKIKIEINIIFISETDNIHEDDIYISTTNNLVKIIQKFSAIEYDSFLILNSVIERTSTLKPRKSRSAVERADSRGSKIKKIEAKIANLDAAQKRAAIEFPDGPQRIRGLAGSGKTIVLAMKASYLHLKNPNWRIAFSFYTRSLYQQLTGLVRRFSFEFIKDEPNWEKITILHAWGSTYTKGLYAEMAEEVGATVRNYQYASQRFAYGKEFEGVIEELYEFIRQNKIIVKPIYDAVLIDEAQDLPQKFFELVFMFTKPPHRIVYAYDELQTLNETEMPSPQNLFGQKTNNQPRVTLTNSDDRPKQDIVLPVCYRNNQWALTTAHGLGFGIERQKGLVQMFQNPSTWTEIGYEVLNGSLSLGSEITLRRAGSATPSFFSDILDPEDAIIFSSYKSEEEEFSSVAKLISKNLKNDELEPDDILIVVSEIMKIRSKGGAIMRHLAKEGIISHIVGVTQSTDEVFSKSSVAITHIHRAKGNEAPMVYVVGADYCNDGFNIGTLRNVLFTAITRSKAWVRVSGFGPGMDGLIDEFKRIKQEEFCLNFKYPTLKQLSRIKTRYREMGDVDVKAIEADLASISRIIPLIKSGKISILDLPKDVSDALRGLIDDADNA